MDVGVQNHSWSRSVMPNFPFLFHAGTPFGLGPFMWPIDNLSIEPQSWPLRIFGDPLATHQFCLRLSPKGSDQTLVLYSRHGGYASFR